jgi:hypothetical protein
MYQIYNDWKPISLDAVIDILSDIKLLHKQVIRLMASVQKQTSLSTDFSLCLQLTEWIPKVGEDHMYLSMLISLDKNDPEFYLLRVAEGYKEDENSSHITETGSFITIKSDVESVRRAIEDTKNGTIPLWNKGYDIDMNAYPYIYDDVCKNNKI